MSQTADYTGQRKRRSSFPSTCISKVSETMKRIPTVQLAIFSLSCGRQPFIPQDYLLTGSGFYFLPLLRAINRGRTFECEPMFAPCVVLGMPKAGPGVEEPGLKLKVPMGCAGLLGVAWESERKIC